MMTYYERQALGMLVRDNGALAKALDFFSAPSECYDRIAAQRSNFSGALSAARNRRPSARLAAAHQSPTRPRGPHEL
jgi:hypothetical protein